MSEFSDTLLPKRSILAISPYVGGVSHIQGVERVIKLSSNENPWGTSPHVQSVLATKMQKLPRYPDGYSAVLTQALAAKYEIEPSGIVCGAGSDDILYLLIQAFVESGDEVLYAEHGFLIYKISTLIVGGVPVPVPEKNLTADIDAFLAAITPRTRAIFIANPNNPTGTFIPFTEIKRLLNNVPSSVLVVLDEAYVEFVSDETYRSGLDLVKDYPNLVVTRTFSKLYGLAALRVGWGYCSEFVASILHRIRSPFNVNLFASEAAVACLQDQTWFNGIIQKTIEQRQRIQKSLWDMGYDLTPSQGNFVLVHFSDRQKTAQECDLFLRRKGIIIRNVGSYNLPNSLRITVGCEEENDVLLEAMKEFIS